MLYDIVIIGGGIAGLYSAYNIIKNNKYNKYNKLQKILIIERNNYLGGRIKTIKKKILHNNYYIESGAERFNNKHKLLIQLINELKLSNKIINIDYKINFIPSKNYKKNENTYFIKESPFKYINKVIIYAKKYEKDKKDNLKKYTFIDYAVKKNILKPKEIKFILDSLGYYKEIIDMNLYNIIKLCESLNTKLQFYKLKGGLSQIIDKLKQFIINKNCNIMLNNNVKNIIYNPNKSLFNIIINKNTIKKPIKTPIKKQIKNTNKIIIAKKCIITIPKPDLLKFNILSTIKSSLKSINYVSLCKIFAIFSKSDIWFKDISKTTTNNNLRYIIPLDKEKGLIMISYSDGKYADYWNNLYLKDKALFLKKIKDNIYKTFHINMPNPIFIKPYYWNIGTHYWKKNKNSITLLKKILQPYPTIPLYICGENYSENQGWIEGALETSKKVTNII